MIFSFFIFLLSYLIVECKLENKIKPKIRLYPNQESFKFGEKVVISCRSQNNADNQLFLYHNGEVLIYKCIKYIKNPDINVNCDTIGDYYVINVTYPKVTLDFQGKYKCIHDPDEDMVNVSVTVLPKLSVKLAAVNMKSIEDSDSKNNGMAVKSKFMKPTFENITGVGTVKSPFNIRSNFIIKSIEFQCDTSCSYPTVDLNWNLFPRKEESTLRKFVRNDSLVNVQSKISALKPTVNNRNCVSNITIRTSSRILINCLSMKLRGLYEIRCSTNSKNGDDVEYFMEKHLYFICPDFNAGNVGKSSNIKSYRMRVTTGEVINIIVGCTIGIFMIIVGIIMICRNRTNKLPTQQTFNPTNNPIHNNNSNMPSNTGYSTNYRHSNPHTYNLQQPPFYQIPDQVSNLATGPSNFNHQTMLPSYSMGQDENSNEHNGYRV